VPETDEPELWPLFLKIAGREVLVVGAGAVAERKIRGLLDARARVRVVAPEASPEVQRWAREGAIEWRPRRFEPQDADGVWVALAATSDRDVQHQVARAAEIRRLFVVAVDDPANASAYSAAIVRRAPLTVAISSSGATPALTRLLREVIEEVLPHPDWIAHAQALRTEWLASAKPMGERFADLVRELANRAK
jgi:uroporphyrin-III C-methyltransferase/precorrin-2 dehydrogenase/sirohydrochlorin ferrochelatase